MDKYVITAAGGNATAIGVIKDPQDRSWYEKRGTALMDEFTSLDVEQVGFLVLSQDHFEMSGGELCGNGSRAAGLLFSKLNGAPNTYEFTTSGHKGVISVDITNGKSSLPFVTGVFPNLDATAKSVSIPGIEKAELVDLGGIVHVIVYGDMPPTRNEYEDAHKRITAKLGLTERDAVGVDWITLEKQQVQIHPVVWVRAIDTYFYETSCGSGSISVAAATGITAVVQPSGETITVANTDGVLTIASKMEVVYMP